MRAANTSVPKPEYRSATASATIPMAARTLSRSSLWKRPRTAVQSPKQTVIVRTRNAKKKTRSGVLPQLFSAKVSAYMAGNAAKAKMIASVPSSNSIVPNAATRASRPFLFSMLLRCSAGMGAYAILAVTLHVQVADFSCEITKPPSRATGFPQSGHVAIATSSLGISRHRYRVAGIRIPIYRVLFQVLVTLEFWDSLSSLCAFPVGQLQRRAHVPEHG